MVLLVSMMLSMPLMIMTTIFWQSARSQNAKRYCCMFCTFIRYNTVVSCCNTQSDVLNLMRVSIVQFHVSILFFCTGKYELSSISVFKGLNCGFFTHSKSCAFRKLKIKNMLIGLKERICLTKTRKNWFV